MTCLHYNSSSLSFAVTFAAFLDTLHTLLLSTVKRASATFCRARQLFSVEGATLLSWATVRGIRTYSRVPQQCPEGNLAPLQLPVHTSDYDLCWQTELPDKKMIILIVYIPTWSVAALKIFLVIVKTLPTVLYSMLYLVVKLPCSVDRNHPCACLCQCRS